MKNSSKVILRPHTLCKKKPPLPLNYPPLPPFFPVENPHHQPTSSSSPMADFEADDRGDEGAAMHPSRGDRVRLSPPLTGRDLESSRPMWSRAERADGQAPRATVVYCLFHNICTKLVLNNFSVSITKVGTGPSLPYFNKSSLTSFMPLTKNIS